MFSVPSFLGLLLERPRWLFDRDRHILFTHTATSTAPRVGRKRRLSTPEPDDQHEREHTPASKKFRAESETDATPPPATPVPAPETETEVKEVTQGVKEVELEEKPSAAEEVKEKDEEEVCYAREGRLPPRRHSRWRKATCISALAESRPQRLRGAE